MTSAPRTSRPGAVAAALLLSVVTLTACSSDPEPEPAEGRTATPTGTATPTEEAADETTEEATDEPAEEATDEPAEPAPHPISVAALAAADLTGGGLRLGRVRERTPRFTSYDVSWRSTTAGRGTRPLRITGVLNVPEGDGPFPGVVLAHGYIDPAIYVSGQGMTRERGFLADRGFVALHVDYRNHAGSSDDPRVDTAVRLGYTADVVAAVRALRSSDDVPVDDRRIGLFGRSMGSGVVLKALAVEPGLVTGAAAWGSVSSLEAENFQHFQARDTSRAQLRAELRERHGLPQDDPGFWRGISSRPAFDEITEPVLLVHGRFDDTCPPRWARATQRALVDAGVDSTLEWYADGHAFGPEFVAAMDRTVAFLRQSNRTATS